MPLEVGDVVVDGWMLVMELAGGGSRLVLVDWLTAGRRRHMIVSMRRRNRRRSMGVVHLLLWWCRWRMKIWLLIGINNIGQWGRGHNLLLADAKLSFPARKGQFLVGKRQVSGRKDKFNRNTFSGGTPEIWSIASSSMI